MSTVDEDPIPYLVIGYGNTIRSDDGVGYRVAEAVAAWNLKQVKSRPVHQLTLDLAEEIGNTNVVIFIDAVDARTVSTKFQMEQLSPDSTQTCTGHYTDPRSLLSLSKFLYATVPTAYRILIPALDFRFGETFSPITQIGFSLALTAIKQLVCELGIKEMVPIPTFY